MSDYNVAKRQAPFISTNGQYACRVISIDRAVKNRTLAVFYHDDRKRVIKMANTTVFHLNMYPVSYGYDLNDIIKK